MALFITSYIPLFLIVIAKQLKDGSDYLLKYNINDLESAPWLNGGKRKI